MGVVGAPGNRALGVKLAKMFDIPGIAHRNAIFGLQADCAGPSDSYYPIRSFPLRRFTPKAGSERLAQQPEDNLPQGASHPLGATALAQAHHNRALEVTRI